MRLSAENLAGERGGERVFSGVSFELNSSEALIVTGENGSGKSTLLRVIAGLLPIADGKIVFDDGNAYPDFDGKAGGELGENLHYLGHQNAMKTALSVEENLRFWQAEMGAPHLEIGEALEMVGLETVSHLPFGYLSTGQRRRISIAKLLISYRAVWLLDEPTAGLDLASERQFAGLMRAHLEDGGIIVAATHLPLGLDGVKELRMGEAS